MSGERTLTSLVGSLMKEPFSPNATFIATTSRNWALPSTIVKKSYPSFPKRNVLVSYVPSSPFVDRQFISELARQLTELGLQVWINKELLSSPLWLVRRIEAAEKCDVAILILSRAFFSDSATLCEGRLLSLRLDPSCIFGLVLDPLETAPPWAEQLLTQTADLTGLRHCSVHERVSMAIAALSPSLEFSQRSNSNPLPMLRTSYQQKLVTEWTVSDVQSWLIDMRVNEFHRSLLAERMVDGFLLESIRDSDLLRLGFDRAPVRRRLLTRLQGRSTVPPLSAPIEWLDGQRSYFGHKHPRQERVYITFDPSEGALAGSLKTRLQRMGWKVLYRSSMRSFEEAAAGPGGHVLASCAHCIVLVTERAATSSLVLAECTLALSLRRVVLVILIQSSIVSFCRPGLRAVLADAPTVDLQRVPVDEALQALNHLMRPTQPSIVIGASFQQRVSADFRPFSHFGGSIVPSG